MHGCRNQETSQEFPMPSSFLTQIRALGEQYFRLRAAALRPLLEVLGTSVLEEHAKTVVRAYMAQAVALPIAWENLESLIDWGRARKGLGTGRERGPGGHGTGPAHCLASGTGQELGDSGDGPGTCYTGPPQSSCVPLSLPSSRQPALRQLLWPRPSGTQEPAPPARLPHGTQALGPPSRLVTPALGSSCPPSDRGAIPSTTRANTQFLQGGCRHHASWHSRSRDPHDLRPTPH